MILTVNIGNTHITVGGYEQDTLIFCGRLHSDPAATVEEYAIRLVNLLQLYGASPAQIEGGIKKEVSVGCSVERCVCSICGEDINTCAHKKGEVYGGKVCCAELVNAQDAYEWSFVAVPAQPRAGVLKRCGGEDAGTLKTLVKRRGSRANQRELESLEKQAEVGKRYLSELRGEVKRLMLVCEQEADGEAIEKLAEKLDESELKEMEKLYRGKMAKKLGLRTQLTYGEKTKAAEDESDFRV